ncbi:hypothetical protein PUNSTDRAFT_52872 [Punctularia strigosozonata HHB-11173 SS5]|uniref:uncharacterized protein n=1 Tax=Punctularia strigosozonata (strain HHB-11173) TaxID=741275 RepID=UPI000441839B|nr:uncharacterized protein PUNSTDRAFT_52872 [Punctularia strigosozonata HHB-11173 SS5]EIN08477.1 hypothetical protein PUNSTDRAFT_52872 [Punctularia strigosozonata HHB-11173 SS5]
MPSFTVYIDQEPTPAPSAKPKGLGRSLSDGALSVSSSRSWNSTSALGDDLRIDKNKENLHPLTGEQAQSVAALYKSLKQKKENAVADVITRKRKTGVLETKVISAPAAKKAKPCEANSGQKTRQPLTRSVSLPGSLNTSPETSPRSKAKAVRARAPPKRRTRQPALPSVVEDEEEHEVARLLFSSPPRRPSRSITMPELHAVAPTLEAQAVIDARCYDLTVAPLADVSEAYEGSPSSERAPKDVCQPESRSKTPSHSLELRDYFSSPATCSQSIDSPVTTASNVDRRSCAPSPSSPAFRHSQARDISTPSEPVRTYDITEPSSDDTASDTTMTKLTYPSAFDLYSSPSHSPVDITKSSLPVLSSSSPIRGSDSEFSTPQRNQIYKAFTFESPSPAGERMHRTQRERSTSVDRFGDIPFAF